jgi:hypothetical protein
MPPQLIGRSGDVSRSARMISGPSAARHCREGRPFPRNHHLPCSCSLILCLPLPYLPLPCSSSCLQHSGSWDSAGRYPHQETVLAWALVGSGPGTDTGRSHSYTGDSAHSSPSRDRRDLIHDSSSGRLPNRSWDSARMYPWGWAALAGVMTKRHRL